MPLRPQTVEAIRAVARGTPPTEVPEPVLRTPTKRPREEVPELKGGYREERRAIRVRNDELGELIREHTALFRNNGWEKYVTISRGRGDLAPVGENVKAHPANHLLEHLATKGAPVIMSSPPWKLEVLEQRLKRGSHKSCDANLDFLRKEMLDFVKKGFWTVLPFSELSKKFKEGTRYLRDLRLSPMGVIPQRERRPRLIVDYSFYDVNQETLQLGPRDAMQFGRALERVLYQVRHANPRFGPVYLGKVDLADGFCRVWVSPGAIPKLAVALPVYQGEEPMVALPFSLPMGWMDSVPWFCTPTETVADIANSTPTNVHMPPHPLEQLADTPPPAKREDLTPATTGVRTTIDNPRISTAPPVLRPFRKPTKFTDIFIDDYILGAQGDTNARLQHTRRLLHAIDQVFRPVDSDDPAVRNHVPSVKKFLKGDAYMWTRKVILGWLLDTIQGTLELPPHRILRLLEIFDYLRDRDRVGDTIWWKFLGKLRNMSVGIPGSKGLFSMLQEGLKHSDAGRLRITPAMRDQIDDFEYLAKDLAARPTSIAELVPDHPVAVGPHDASGKGMGGVWLPSVTHSNLEPTLWRAKFPESIRKELVSFDNPEGTINNSQLELAGGIAQNDVLNQRVNCTGRTVVPMGDNTPATSWQHKGSASTVGPTAYLLRVNSLHQRHYRYLSKADYMAGPVNQMADDCSRLWYMTDSQLLAYFDLTYPQERPWQLVHLRPEMLSTLTKALLQQRPEPQSFLGELSPKMATGAFGKVSLPILKVSTPTSMANPSQSSFLFSKFSPRDSAPASLRPAVTLSGVDQWRTTYGPSVRRLHWTTRRA